MGVGLSAPVRRGEVYLVTLNPTRGGELRKTRPCVVVSPDEMNAVWPTFIVVPLSTGRYSSPFWIECRFGGRDGRVVLDQIRVVDRVRLVKRLGALTDTTLLKSLNVLQEMFAA
jgi:mRNA interferase MazF